VNARAPLQAVLFDLDGTLLDTAPDMAGALNRLRAEHGLDALPYALLRPYVSRGSNGLLTVSIGAKDTDAGRAALVERFLAIYSAHLCDETKPFDGMSAVLAWLEERNVPWGIVTNKPIWLARPLLAQIGLLTEAACLVGGDSLPERKPHPRPLLHAAELIGADGGACVYVGDDLRDVQAAHAAGMGSIVARWGYVPPDEEPSTWGADDEVESPHALLAWLRTQSFVKR
jgi:phosphoglycolate phosphatase